MTSDHITSQKDNMLGVTGDRDAYVIRDVWSKLKHLYPTKTKDTNDTEQSIRDFIGMRKCGVMYSDNANEIKNASERLKISPHTSQPGMPQNNAVAERTNQDMLAGTRTNLEQAGVPVCFWPYAAEHYCVVDNTSHAQVAANKEDLTPWQKTHGEDFKGLRIPFGCAVTFKPNPTKEGESHKFSGDAIDGIFAGYELGPGYTWHGLYRVWALKDFVDTDLSKFGGVVSHRQRALHKVKALELPKMGIHFPLKQEYDRKNHSLEGLN